MTSFTWSYRRCFRSGIALIVLTGETSIAILDKYGRSSKHGIDHFMAYMHPSATMCYVGFHYYARERWSCTRQMSNNWPGMCRCSNMISVG